MADLRIAAGGFRGRRRNRADRRRLAAGDDLSLLAVVSLHAAELLHRAGLSPCGGRYRGERKAVARCILSGAAMGNSAPRTPGAGDVYLAAGGAPAGAGLDDRRGRSAGAGRTRLVDRQPRDAVARWPPAAWPHALYNQPFRCLLYRLHRDLGHQCRMDRAEHMAQRPVHRLRLATEQPAVRQRRHPYRTCGPISGFASRFRLSSMRGCRHLWQVRPVVQRR